FKIQNSSFDIQNLKQEEDVVDTWFSSWLWPISVFDGFKNPDNKDINYYYPTNDLITAPEILFFWVARMIIAGYEYKKEKPFTNVYLTGIVRDKQGRKMSKSLGNSFLPHELISGNNNILKKGYSPMTVRFFMLQAHYRSTLDFGNEAMEASEKGFKRLMNAFGLLGGLKASATTEVEIQPLLQRCYDAMNDDFNSPVLIAELFEASRVINSVHDGKMKIDAENLNQLKHLMNTFVLDVLGLKNEQAANDDLPKLMGLVVSIRNEAKASHDYATSDKIRNGLQQIGFQLNDSKEGTSWNKI
ncbi:MAG: class I tRNA ligase family protein, partial [Mucilaginibacter sp.]